MREMVAAVGFLFYVPIPHSLFLRPLFLAVYTAAGRQETSFSGKLPPLSSGGSAIHSIALGSPPTLLVSKFLFLTAGMGMISLPLLLFPPISFISPCDGGRRSLAHCRQIISQINF